MFERTSIVLSYWLAIRSCNEPRGLVERRQAPLDDHDGAGRQRVSRGIIAKSGTGVKCRGKSAFVTEAAKYAWRRRSYQNDALAADIAQKQLPEQWGANMPLGRLERSPSVL